MLNNLSEKTKFIILILKKKIFGGALLLAIAATAAFNVNFNMNKSDKLSSIALANIEALAQSESGAIELRTCYRSGDVTINDRLDTHYRICASGTSSTTAYKCAEPKAGKKKVGSSLDSVTSYNCYP